MSTLRRGLMMLNTYGVPLGFEKLEYIENTSMAYIDTGVQYESSDKPLRIVTERQVTTNGTTMYDGYTPSGYGYWGVNAYRMKIVYGYYSNYTFDSDTKIKVDIEFGATLKYTVTCDKWTQIQDTKKHPPMQNTTYWIFNINNGRDTSHMNDWKFLCKVYSHKMYVAGTLVRDFIPVKRKSDGEIGLYDVIGKKFYTSPNGVKFIGG